MIIVTGGAGFIGSVLVSRLNSEGIEEIVVVDRLGSADKWKNLNGKKFSDFVHKDNFLSLLSEKKFVRNIDTIFHLGACSSTTERDADYLVANNFSYSRALAEFAALKNIRFIYASSAATYGNGEQGYDDIAGDMDALRPMNCYGFSKQIFDQWVTKERLDRKFVGLKFFNVYGPNEYHKGAMQSVVAKAYRQIKEKGKVELFKSYNSDYADGQQKRDFIYVKDCAEVMLGLMRKRNVCGIFNLGTGVARSWNDLAQAVFAALGEEPKIDYIEMPEDLREQYQYFTQASMKKLPASLGEEFRPYSLEEGIKDYVQNYLELSWPYL
jgi:ADP-L-glycero-D-manno-heptose 6-epimerase